MLSYNSRTKLIFALTFCWGVNGCGVRISQSSLANKSPASEPSDPIDAPYLEDFPIIIDDGAELIPVNEGPNLGSENSNKVDKNCPDAESNIVACVKSWRRDATHRFVTICQLDPSGECSSDRRSLTSYDTDHGKVKFDGIKWKSCEKAPKYQVVRYEDSKIDSEVVTLYPGDVKTGLLCNF